MSKTWKIYMLTNKVTGYLYIGQTCQELEDRWRNGNGYKTYNKPCSTIMSNVIAKYGWDSFDRDILEIDIKTQEEANEREIYYINKYRTYVRFKDCKGYNMTLGGDSREHLGFPVYQIDPKTLKIINQFNSAMEASYYLSDSNIDASHINGCCNGNNKHLMCKGYYWCYVKDYTPDWKPRENQSKIRIYKIDYLFHIVAIYESMRQAALDNGVSVTAISDCCNRRSAQCHGYYWCCENDYTPDWRPIKLTTNRHRLVYILEVDTIFKDAQEASDTLGISKRSILKCCEKVELKTAGGYHCCFADEKEEFLKNFKNPLDKRGFLWYNMFVINKKGGFESHE